MAAPIVKSFVPWINRYEFLKVYEELFGNNIDEIQHAVNRIKAWKSRTDKLPVSIESTAELQTVVLLYHNALLTHTLWENEQQIRREYSLAIIRFVNHATESGQKEQFAVPIIAIAREYGIPDWIVHLRHEVTHNTLPPLDVLIRGVHTALDWLKETFWEKQVEEFPQKTSEIKNTYDIRNILRKYVDQRLQQMQNSHGVHTLNRLSKDLKMGLSQPGQKNELLILLCREDCLTSSPEQLTLLGIQSKDLTRTTSLVLPSELVLFWKPLLKFIKKLGYGADLVKHLIDGIEDEDGLKTRLIVGWIYHLTFHWENINSNKKGTKISFIKSSSYSCILREIMRKPNKYSTQLIEHLCEQCSLSVQIKTKLKDVLYIYQHQYIDPSNLSTDDLQQTDKVIYNIHDILPQQTMKIGKWEYRYSNIDWSTVPLGGLPNQELQCNGLEMRSAETDFSMEFGDDAVDTQNNNSHIKTIANLRNGVTDKPRSVFTEKEQLCIKNKILSCIT